MCELRSEVMMPVDHAYHAGRLDEAVAFHAREDVFSGEEKVGFEVLTADPRVLFDVMHTQEV
jgi:hypothetical protein